MLWTQIQVTHLSQWCQIARVSLPDHLAKVASCYSPWTWRYLIEQLDHDEIPISRKKVKGLAAVWNTLQMEYQVLLITLVTLTLLLLIKE